MYIDLYSNWNISKFEGKSVLMNLRTMFFSKHFIMTLVEATVLKSFTHSGEFFLGTGTIIDLRHDGTNGCP